MASSPEFVSYLCEQLEGTGEVRSRKMFGEYMVYLNDKPVLLVCDNTPFVKTHPCVARLLKDRPTALPYEGYEGTKEHYVLDLDDGETLRQAVLLLEAVTPVPKKKAPRKKEPSQPPASWDTVFPQHIQPAMDDIAAWVGSPLFLELRDWIGEAYGARPAIEFSRCAMDWGWNVKYRKGAKALCACYIRKGYFTCMVTLGRKPINDLEVLLPTFSEDFQKLYQDTPPFNSGKWLVLDVKEREQLENVKRLILLKAKPKKPERPI